MTTYINTGRKSSAPAGTPLYYNPCCQASAAAVCTTVYMALDTFDFYMVAGAGDTLQDAANRKVCCGI